MQPLTSPTSTPSLFSARGSRLRCLPVSLTTVALTLSLAGLAGCGGNVSIPVGGGPTGPTPANYMFLTGNWEIQATPTVGPTPFTALAGFINEQAQDPGTYDVTTGAFQATPSACYDSAITIPLQGATENTALKMGSFSVNGQYITLSATKDTTATHLTGTYSIAGGCAKGATGTLSGTRYAQLVGTYAGSINGTTPAQTMALTLSQFVQGTGEGDFLISGNAVFTGSACFTKGTMAATAGSVLGSGVSLTFNTNDASGAQVVVNGTFDPGATTITATSVQVTGGSCATTYTGATLAKQ